MNQTTSSTIELTTKDNQNHRSQVISKGKRSQQRVSSRSRSAKEQKDALEKIKLFRKRNKKLNEKFSNKIIYIKEKKAEKTSTIKTLSKHQKQVNEKTDTKTKKSSELKPAKEQETNTELESTTSTLNHHHEENTADQNDTSTNTNSLSAMFTDDVTLPKTSPINKKKYQHASTNNDYPTTEDLFAESESNNKKNETNTKTYTFSTDTDTTAMTSNSDFITVTSDINELKTEDVDDKLKKNKCKWCSIIFVIGGFIILCTVYYLGTSFLKEKCKQDIDFYVNNLSPEVTSVSIEKFFELFDGKHAYTKCKWLRKTNVQIILEEKFAEKLRINIDDFFNNYEKQMTPQYQMEQKGLTDFENLIQIFLKMQKFYKPLTNYFQEKKIQLEENKEKIPVYIEVSGFKAGYNSLNGRYDLYFFGTKYYKPVYHNRQTNQWFRFNEISSVWRLSYDVKWKNTASVLHPGKLGAQKPTTSDDKEIDNIQITTILFPLES